MENDVFSSMSNRIDLHVKDKNKKPEQIPSYIWTRAMSPVMASEGKQDNKFEQSMKDNNKAEGEVGVTG